MIHIILPPVSDTHESDPFYIKEVVPLERKDSAYPDLLVIRLSPNGEEAAPLQLLEYTNGEYRDATEKNFKGSAGNAIHPMNGVVADFNGKGPGVFIADHGLHKDPWPGGQNILLLPESDGRLINTTANLPQELAFSHHASAGIIDDSGNIAIFVANLWSRDQKPCRLLINDGNGDFYVDQSRLPEKLNRLDQRFASAALIDVTGDGIADLILGPENSLNGSIKIYKNPGNGDFSQADPFQLPTPSFAPVKGAHGDELKGSIVLDIKPIKRKDSAAPDLLIVSTNANYTEYAVHILENDGKGNFAENTTERFNGNPIRGAGGWIEQVYIADLEDGTQMLVTKTNSLNRKTRPLAQVFLSDPEKGKFVFQKEITDGYVCGLASIGGEQKVILSDGLGIRLEPALTNGPERNNVQTYSPKNPSGNNCG